MPTTPSFQWPKGPRLVIQISAIDATPEHSMGTLALCSDGTLWISYFIDGTQTVEPVPSGWTDWEQLPNVPQREVAE